METKQMIERTEALIDDLRDSLILMLMNGK